MPPTFVYILALMGYLAVACAVWLVAVVLAVPKQTRALATRRAAGMAGSFPGVFLFQLLTAPVVAFVLLFIGGIFWLFHPGDVVAGVLIIVLAFLTFGIVAIASLLGFYAGWRAAWEFADGRSVRAFFSGDRLLGPVVRVLRRRLPVLQKVL